MQLSEFFKAPRGPRKFDYWTHPAAVPSPLGDFIVELYPEIGEPDEKMVGLANTLTIFLSSHPEKIVDKVFDHYKRFLENPSWLLSCQVPTNLQDCNLAPYMKSLNLTVSRDGIRNQYEYNTCIYISPQWDEEHAIYLELTDDEVDFCEP
jgi:hypothetical protein